MSAHVDALRDLPPGTDITVTQRGRRFGVIVNASGIVRDYDAARADAEHYKAEAEKWQALASRLADQVVEA
jgi:hypothetical protein